MFPVGIFIAIAARALLNQRTRQGAAPPASQPATGWWQTPVRWSMAWLAIQIFGVAPVFIISLGGVLTGDASALLHLVASAAVLFPGTIARRLLVPLGMPRAAYRWLSVPSLATVGDTRSPALLAAAQALTRCRRSPERQAVWLEGKLAKDNVVGAVDVVVCGLLAAWRGEVATARRMLLAMQLWPPARAPLGTVRQAADWLAADAAQRGDWDGVIEIEALPHFSTRFTCLLAAVGRRFTGRFDPTLRPRLRRAWLASPHRRATHALVVRALRASPAAAATAGSRRSAPVARPGAVEPAVDPLPAALALHAATLLQWPPAASPPAAETPAARQAQRASPRRAALLDLARAWQRAFADPSLLRRLRLRAAHLRASSATLATEAVGAMRQAVDQDLTALALDLRLTLAELEDEGLGSLAAAVRNELLARLEAAVAAIARRVEAARTLPALDELREWVLLCTLYDDVVSLGGPELRRLAFSQVHRDTCALAVWLFNKRGQKPLAHAMLRWLFHEAEAVGDREAVALQRKNLAIAV